MSLRSTFAGGRAERALADLAFFLLFPGFFFYHTLLGIGATGAFLGGYFAPIALGLLPPLCVVHVLKLRRDPLQLSRIDIYFAMFLAYFTCVVAVNGASGANPAIVVKHVIEITFLVDVFIIFRHLDFAHRTFRAVTLLSIVAMSAIVYNYSVDGVFYLGAMGIARDADSLATYQGFSRSYLFTFMAAIAFTRASCLRAPLYALAASSLFLNSARSEFAALLFAIPIIELYFAKQKLVVIGALVALVLLVSANLDQILALLPNNRILELLDLSRSTSANKRHHLSVAALNTISAYPVFGDYASYAPGYYSHNVLSAWVDLGLFGIVCLLALLILPAVPMFIRDYFAAQDSGVFLLPFALACITTLLLITSHYFTDMLIAATLGTYSRYSYERKYAKSRPPDLGPSAPRHQDLRQAVPQPGRARL
jgi:hypothetical protein